MADARAIEVLCVGAAARRTLESASHFTAMRLRDLPVEGHDGVADRIAGDVVVIGPDVGDPFRSAQNARTVAPLAQFIFFAGAEELERLRTALPFVPNMSSAWTAEASASASSVADLVCAAAKAAHQRDEVATVNSRINERLAAHSLLAESERRLRHLAVSERYLGTLLAQSPDAFVAVSTDGIVQAWNDAAARLFSASMDGAIGSPLNAILPRALVDEIEPWIKPGHLPSGVQRGETSFPRDERTSRWIEWSIAPIADVTGAVETLSITFRDISERRAALARLHESEARYRILTEALPQLVWTCLPDGSCNYLSPQWVAYTGVPQEEQLGLRWLDAAVHPDDKAPTLEHWIGAVDGNHDYDTDFRLRRHDGVFRWFKARATPVRDTAGRIVYWFGTCTDIQEIFEAREALARSAEELEARVAAEVAERSKAEDALRQAQKMEAVGQLTGGIAHDFNNLLQGIVGSIDLIKKRLEQGRAADSLRLLEGAAASANRAAALTHRLLAFARRQPLNPTPVDPNALIRSMEDLLHRTLDEQIRLELALAPDAWMTMCDSNQLESAVLNLSINARDAMPNGGRLMIETANTTFDTRSAAQSGNIKPGDYVCISVSDTGTGMAADVLSKAFDPFFTTKPIGQGTGLGLSMIYGFAHQSGGHVKLYSQEGRGTTAKIFLPRHAGALQERPADRAPAVEPVGSGEVVLVVEDEPVVRGLVVEVLTELGYRPLEAEDGPGGLQIMRSAAHIDLLITDIGLPGLNGRQLAEAARLITPGLKVLFMTGYAEIAATSNAVLEPGMAMITKPFSMEVLASRIRNMMKAPA